ncbi:MAG: phosphate/phosphite/phosphonate ABC transporter substrate-binding protein [Boseongicola sp.]
MKLVRTTLALLLAVAVLGAPAAHAEALVLGSVSNNVKKHLKRFAPLASHLESELAEEGVTSVEILVLPNAVAMIEAMRNGEVDLYFDSPLVAARVARDSGGEPFLRRWKRGVGSYHSVILVPTDSEMTTVEDLTGRRIAFQEPDSTSGFLLPVGMMRRLGLTLRELPTRDSRPQINEVGYIFTNDDRNTLAWIYNGWVDAAATDSERFLALEAAAPGAFRVLARSIEVPRQVIVRRNGLDKSLIAAVTGALIDLENSAAGRDILENFNHTTRFDRFPNGVEDTFNPIYAILDELSEQNVF